MIEVALPLERISAASRADKNRKTGTLKNIHKWFAPMPTPAVRALLFAAVVTAPEDVEDLSRLQTLIERLCPEGGQPPGEDVLREARDVLLREGRSPTVVDPFCGAGSTLVEAVRLGLCAVGSDLNPVPALIARTAAELLPAFAAAEATTCDPNRFAHGAVPYEGISADLRVVASKVLESARAEVGSYWEEPTLKGDPEAWIWAQTVRCHNPACRVRVPLLANEVLAKGNHPVEVMLTTEDGLPAPRLVRESGAGNRTKLGRGAAFSCPVCHSVLGEEYIRRQSTTEGLSHTLLAVLTREGRIRGFVEADQSVAPSLQSEAATQISDGHEKAPFIPLVGKASELSRYGFEQFADIWTPRQVLTLASLAKAVRNVESLVALPPERLRLIRALCGLTVSKLAMASSMQSRWFVDPRSGGGRVQPAFGRHDLGMIWDFAEANPFSDGAGSWNAQVESLLTSFAQLPRGAVGSARVSVDDARIAVEKITPDSLLFTDPPYFNQISYADLSDFFYLWLRLALGEAEPDLFATIATPKSHELVAQASRHSGSQKRAAEHFIGGFGQIFRAAAAASLGSDFPMVIVYAARQNERPDRRDTAWSAMLGALVGAGQQIVATWPIHATHTSRQIGQGANALASYVVLVTRPRPVDAPIVSQRDFVLRLRAELPARLRELQRGSIPPVDLAQAAIGPGMEVFTGYSGVISPDGAKLDVVDALELVNRALDEVLSSREGDFDSDTRFCITWFDEYGWDESEFGRAEDLARSRNTSVRGLVDGGVFWARANRARLLAPEELSEGWDPSLDDRLSVWEATARLAHSLGTQGMEAAAALLNASGRRVDPDAVRDLAYLLFSLSERKHRTETALLFNQLASSWSDLAAATRRVAGRAVQGTLTLDEGE
jgi:putative DNA methylase